MLNLKKTTLLVGAIAAGISFEVGVAPVRAATLVGDDVTSVNVGSLIDNPNAKVNNITYLNQSLPVTSLKTSTSSWNLSGISTTLSLRRSGVGTVAGRQIVWSERPTQNPTTTVRGTLPSTTEAALNQNNFFMGTDNLFVNAGSSNGNMSDVERVDFITSALGVKVRDSKAVTIFERGSLTQHDGFKIAAITALDKNGLPSAYGKLYSVNAGWGKTALRTNSQSPIPNPSPNPYYSVLNNTGTNGAFKNTADISSQNIGGVLITLDKLAAKGSKIYGYSLFAVDVDDKGNSNNLVNWKNSNIFKTNTQEGATQGGGGIDLVAVNTGIVKDPTKEIPESSNSLALVLLGAAMAFVGFKSRKELPGK